MIIRTFKTMLRVGLIALPALAVAVPALAQTESITTVHKLLLDKVTTVGGKTTHQVVNPTETHDLVVPGSHMIARIDYHNNLAQQITNLSIDDALPKALALSDDSARDFDVSVDGGKTFGKLAALTFTDAKGTTRAAQASDVTTVRLVIGQIAPGGSGTIEFHAVVR